MPAPPPSAETFSLLVALDIVGGRLELSWQRQQEPRQIRRGWVEPNPTGLFLRMHTLYLRLEGSKTTSYCSPWPASTRAFVKRLGALYAVPRGDLSFAILSPET